PLGARCVPAVLGWRRVPLGIAHLAADARYAPHGDRRRRQRGADGDHREGDGHPAAQETLMISLPATTAIALRREGSCLHLTLNRPEVRNAINEAMWNEIEAVFGSIKEDRSIKAVVLRGAGGYFCSGADLKERRSFAAAAAGEGDPLVARSRKAGRLLL